MLRRLLSNEKITTGRFGVFCPYWIKIDGQVFIADTAEEIINIIPEDRRIIDPISCLELLNFNYMLGNRTLVQNVHRLPWRSELDGQGCLRRLPPIPHNNREILPIKAAETLQSLLEDELFNACHPYQRIFLLLTGGLDSRIVAGILKKIQSKLNAEIICITWGSSESRDVVYASRIADWFDWKFIPLDYNEKLTLDNIHRGAIWGGSEVAGIHLHNMCWFEKNASKSDLVIAASFGDSIGRAEFSSVHLKELRKPKIRNIEDLIHRDIVNDCIENAYIDLSLAWEKEENYENSIITNELSQQENYMRRMIAHAMNFIRQSSNLYQAFTSEKVVEFMWSLSPDCRNDSIYNNLIKNLDVRLYNLPWARNGTAPSGYQENNVNLKKEYHRWSMWLKKDLKDQLEKLFFSKGLEELGIFNVPALKNYWNRWTRESPMIMGRSQNIVKICSLEVSRNHFQLLPYRKSTPTKDSIIYFMNIGKSKLLHLLR